MPTCFSSATTIAGCASSAPGDTVYGVLPLSHVYGLSALLVASLISGAALLLVPRFSEQALAHALAMRGITVMHGAPAMYAKLLAWSEQTRHALAGAASAGCAVRGRAADGRR